MNAWFRIVRRARARLAGQDGFTLPEVLVVVVIGGVILGVLSGGFLLSAQTTSSASERLAESHDAQIVAAYFNADSAGATYFSRVAGRPRHATDCPSPGIPVAMFAWKEGTVQKDAYYTRPSNTSKELRRRYCEGGAVVSDIPLAKQLDPAKAPEVKCGGLLGCSAAPQNVQLTVHEGSGFNYSLRNAPRPSSASGALGIFSVYISGNLVMKSHSELDALAGIAYVGGSFACNGGANATAGGGLSSPSGGSCGGPASTVVPPQPDPLAGLAYPDPAVLPEAKTTPSTCVPGKPTYEAGVYATSSPSIEGCLGSGIHYFKNGAKLGNVSAAPGASLVIFVEDGDLELGGHPSHHVNLADLADNDYGNVVVFLHRGNDGTITTKGQVTLDGSIYGASSTLDAQTPHTPIFRTTGINVKTMEGHAHLEIIAS